MKKKLGKFLIRIGARLLGQGYFVFNDGTIVLPSQHVTVGIVGGGWRGRWWLWHNAHRAARL